MRKRYLLAAAAASALSLGSGSSAKAASIYFTDPLYDGFGVYTYDANSGTSSFVGPSTYDTTKIAGAAGTIANPAVLDLKARTFKIAPGGSKDFNIFLNPSGLTGGTINTLQFFLSTIPASSDLTNISRELNLLSFTPGTYQTTYQVGTASLAASQAPFILNTNQAGFKISGITFNPADYPGNELQTGGPIFLGSVKVGNVNLPAQSVDAPVADGEPDLTLFLGTVKASAANTLTSYSIRKKFLAPADDTSFDDAAGANGFPAASADFLDQPFTDNISATNPISPNGGTAVQVIDATPAPLETDAAGLAAVGGLAFLTWKKRRDAMTKVMD